MAWALDLRRRGEPTEWDGMDFGRDRTEGLWVGTLGGKPLLGEGDNEVPLLYMGDVAV